VQKTRVILFVFFFILSSVCAVAEGESITTVTTQQVDAAVQSRVDDANRFLSAEVTRAIKKGQEETLAEVKRASDENFQILDVRMSQLMSDAQMRVIIGGIGAILVANALVAIVLSYVSRRYSFEYYQDKIIGQQQTEIADLKGRVDGGGKFQQRSWTDQVPTKTVTDQIGVAAAGSVSAMNAWQHQAARQGAWVPPSDGVSSLPQDYIPQDLQQVYQHQGGADGGFIPDYYPGGVNPESYNKIVPQQDDPNNQNRWTYGQ
jgi:hypothetical protein